MGKYSDDFVAEVGKRFLEYLCETNLLRTWSKPELNEIYQEFRESKRTTPCFSRMLFIVARKSSLLIVKNGCVIFKGTADWSSANSSNPIRRFVSHEIQSERQKIIIALRQAKAKDSFLVSSEVEISADRGDVESSPGYFVCDLDDKTETTFKMVVTSKSGRRIQLEKCLFLKENAAMTLSDDLGCTSLTEPQPVMIEPYSQHTITVSCKIEENVGSYCGDVFFRCRTYGSMTSLLVMRYLRCFRSDDVTTMLMPTSAFVKRRYAKDGDVETIPGERLERVTYGNQLTLSRELKTYGVENSVCSAFCRQVFSHKAGYLLEPDKRKISLLEKNLTISSYAAKFSLLIQIEEKQAERDIRFYDLTQITVSKQGKRFLLKVPGLAEKRPSVLKGDRIYLRQSGLNGESYGKRYEGFVHKVKLDEVELGLNSKFNDLFVNKQKFNVRFSFNRLPIRLQQRAVEDLQYESMEKLLFPNHQGIIAPPATKLRMYNRNIEGNKQQSTAVKRIVDGISTDPFIVYGPPGTGKTMTIVEAIKQIVRMKRKRVLVCAPSNSACDLLTERLLEHVDKKEIFRMHAMSRPVMDVPDVVLEVSNYDKFTEDYYYPSIQTIMDFYLVITTLITAGRLSSAEIPSNHFDYIFIDEAGQSVEPECIIPIESLLGGDGRLVLAGDPKQLGPILRSQAAIEYGLGKSLLERLMESDAYKPNESVYPEQRITKLLSNYRSHEAILKTSNECFYDNELKVEADVFLREQFYNWEHLPKRGFPVIFHGVKGEDQREENSPSYFNPQEASEVYNYVKKILESRQNPVKPKQIGIISPYRKQVQKIRQVLNREKLPISRKIKARNMRRVPEDMEDNSDFKEIKVGSVEEFKGQERRVIIISTVRSNCRHLPHDEKFQLGFLRNPKRFNVAMTRAMSLLIVIGNPEILCKDEHWNKLLTYCIEKGGYTGANFTPDHQHDITMRMNSLGLNEEFLDDNTTEDVSKLQGEVDPPWRDDI